MRKLTRLVFAATLLVLGFASTSSATHTCVLVDNFCSGCTAGKLKSCDRYRCGTYPNYVYFTECGPCLSFC